MNKTEQIIEYCPHFMYGCCQKYLDGDCSAHKCDLKIIRELQQKLLEGLDYYVKPDLSRVKEYNELVDKYKAKEQECEELKEEIKHYKQIAQYHGNLSVKYTNKSAKLKQTLTEIKEIAERCVKRIPLFEIDEIAEDLKQILQKISECEVGK